MDVVLYNTEDGEIRLEVQLDRETVWLTQDQIADLFGRERSVITKHLRNVFKEGELNEPAVCAKFAHTAGDGKTYQVQCYNLDVIISVGYRIKSRRGIQFRQWATRVLREHLVKGFTLNEQRLREQSRKLSDLRRTVSLLEQTLNNQVIGLDEAKGLLMVITDYAYALTTLDRYDHGTVEIQQTTLAVPYLLTYETSMEIVASMKTGFAGLFGMEKDQGFKSALGAIYQTFGGDELYPSVEEKAANLLYFVVKNHAFIDGNKRIGAALFITFLAGNRVLYRGDGSKRIADNALIALTLLIATSHPEQKEIIVNVIVNLINRANE
jgi:prophage maintenance system killer protein